MYLGVDAVVYAVAGEVVGGAAVVLVGVGLAFGEAGREHLKGFFVVTVWNISFLLAFVLLSFCFCFFFLPYAARKSEKNAEVTHRHLYFL